MSYSEWRSWHSKETITMIRYRSGNAFWLVTLLSLAACVTSKQVIPEKLKEQVDESPLFTKLQETPSSYQDRLIIQGGEVLSAIRLVDRTRLQILQLPLNDTLAPGVDRTQSQGRFLAFQSEFLDPAIVPPGTRLTIVGKVNGASVLPLGEDEYRYPILEIQSFTVWPSLSALPYYGPFGTNCGPFRGFYPYGGVNPFAGRIYPLWC